MVTLLAVLFTAAIVALILWWLANQWDPKTKDWCVMFYLTSQVPRSSTAVTKPDSPTGVPAGATLDQKLDQVVETIRALPCGLSNPAAPWDNVYVAYRAIWSKPQTVPEARVVDADSSAPTATYFTGETLYDVGLCFDLSTDITDFFLWTYEKCPAKHYAVFFWGHAMGPGGLFQQSERPIVISPLVMVILRFASWFTGSNQWAGVPGIQSLQNALHAIVLARLANAGGGGTSATTNLNLPAGSSSTSTSSTSSTSSSASSSTALTNSQLPTPKVEAVLFQDCWMAGVETAFELQDDVRYIISSQSIVPIGFAADGSLGPVWPYQQLIECMAANADCGPQLLVELRNFFNANGANRWPLPKVLFSLLDCDKTLGAVSGALQGPFQQLVTALSDITAQQRSRLLDQAFAASGRLFELSNGAIAVGDEALVDLPTMADYLTKPNKWPTNVVVTGAQQTAIVQAATALSTGLTTVIIDEFESPQPPLPRAEPYSGLTALYQPFVIYGDDTYIINNTYRSTYDPFRFANETTVHVSGQSYSWATFAFERTHW